MYSAFVKMLLIACFLLGIINIVFAVIGKRPKAKIWKYILIGLVVIIVGAVIGIIATSVMKEVI